MTLSMCPRFGRQAPEIDAHHSGGARCQRWLATVCCLPSRDSVPETQTEYHDSWSMVNKTFVRRVRSSVDQGSRSALGQCPQLVLAAVELVLVAGELAGVGVLPDGPRVPAGWQRAE